MEERMRPFMKERIIQSYRPDKTAGSDAFCERRIKRNAIKCKKCGDVIESKDRRGMVWCGCGWCAVDGGLDYIRRGFRTDTPEEAYEELSEWE